MNKEILPPDRVRALCAQMGMDAGRALTPQEINNARANKPTRAQIREPKVKKPNRYLPVKTEGNGQ